MVISPGTNDVSVTSGYCRIARGTFSGANDRSAWVAAGASCATDIHSSRTWTGGSAPGTAGGLTQGYMKGYRYRKQLG